MKPEAELFAMVKRISKLESDQRTARDLENEYLRQMLINAIPRPGDSQAMSAIRADLMQSIANVVLAGERATKDRLI